MASVLGTLNTVNRLVCLISLVYALYFLSVNPSPLSKQSIGGMWKYWTNWTAFTLILFYFLAIVCEVFSYLKYRIDDFSHRALIYHGFVVPMGVSVFTSFWALTLINPELVIPAEVRPFLPDHINHILVSFPFSVTHYLPRIFTAYTHISWFIGWRNHILSSITFTQGRNKIDCTKSRCLLRLGFVLWILSRHMDLPVPSNDGVTFEGRFWSCPTRYIYRSVYLIREMAPIRLGLWIERRLESGIFNSCWI